MFKQTMKVAGRNTQGLCSLILGCVLLLALVGCGGGGNTAASFTPTPTPASTPTPTPSSALSVSPGTATVSLSAHQAFTASSSGSPAMVTWSVNGVQGGNSTTGTIDTNGNFTGPANFPSPNTVTVTATLQSNTSQTANSSVTVVYPNNNHATQTPPIELGTTGGNSTDSTTSGMTITCCSGTLGSLLERPQGSGTFFILSNNHVLDKSGQGKSGDPIGHPGLVDNNCNPGTMVATLSQAAAIKPSSGTSGPAPSNVDAAIAQITTGMVDTSGNILDLGAASSSSIAPAPPSSTLATPAVVLSSNEGVAKSGRSSGLTCSNLQSVTTNVSVQYDSSCGGAVAFTATYSNQVVINGANFSAAGDSGSLVVTSDTREPVGLLYAGNSTSTTANPMSDVLNALKDSSNNAPVIVGPAGPQAAVSCDPTASASSVSRTAGANSAQLSKQELDRTTAAKENYASALFRNPAVRDVTVGASVDNPQEGAVVVTVNRAAAIPAQLDGVRTRVIYANSPSPRATVADINRATTIKDAHADNLMSQPGIQGVGVGVSDDNPAEAALVIYVITGMPHPEIPPVIDGLRTKIIEGDRFRAFGWGHETKPSACGQRQQSMRLPKLPLLP